MGKLTTNEILELNKELNNLLSEESISFVTKYDISKMIEKTQKTSESFDKIKLDIFKKYGKLVDGETDAYTLENSDKKEEAIKQLNAILEKTETVNSNLKIDDFKDLKSKYPYRIIYKLFK